MKQTCLAAFAAALLPISAAAQTDDDAFAKATAVGICPFGVASASYSAAGEITAMCLTEEEAVTGFVPLIGGFAPALFPALAFIVGVAGDNGAGNSTGSTTGTN
ncbi:hypothetical protein [Loktanella sp. R86503]|uniref:hypothetical protein n=1 Tax=Loktanella sp. R86503 TaxID=3093847 RepID=UPI0036DF3B2B